MVDDIERLVDADSRGDPESLLRSTAKSVRQIAGALREMGHEVHFTSVATFMRLLGYSSQANVKTKEGVSSRSRRPVWAHQPDRGTYPDKIKIANAELKTVNIAGHTFHPEWNYIIRPHDQ